MNKYNTLLKNISKYVTLTEKEKEKEKFTSIIHTKRVKKRHFIIQPGFVCQYRSYIEKGAFRVYHLDKEGKEHTVSIGVEDWFVTDFHSYITQTPATNYAVGLHM